MWQLKNTSMDLFSSNSDARIDNNAVVMVMMAVEIMSEDKK